MSNPRKPPDALLLINTGCPHCPTVLSGLAELVKQGLIGKLEVVNLSVQPELGEALDVRSVPWLRVGPFELEGLRSLAELRQWATRAGTPRGMADYFGELLGDGQLDKVLSLVRRDTHLLDALLLLLEDEDTELQVRVGIGAVMESFQGEEPLARLIDPLARLTHNRNAHIRGDAAHYLGLTRNARAIPHVESLVNDPEAQVRDIASESLESLRRVTTG
ncbi:MAG: hypothetical protein A2140_01655 [Candidatus Muproteobacteria bacterium RBG_16_62_13]|uniref:Thioredoxin-like fold domain-containing protein n=1 Tax=Candidatus Muproteobacteria bacterium RBG_16_62_13 TaxID=1817756 RepID=A0A1F6SYB2_9PROT|nr:MAG: hypothetical protein A2140_01655 [Candidatus Muproteobacteria bacterium RBG_16_62_13]